MKKWMALFCFGVGIACMLSSCQNSPAPSIGAEGGSPAASELSGKVSLSGSSSMEELAKGLAEGFLEQYPGVFVDVQLGGSSTGIKNVQQGVSDIGNISRALKPTEAGLDTRVIALDSIAVAVNAENPVGDLTSNELAKIYTGEIVNWKEVGGTDEPIQVIGREAGSGTREGFEDAVHILGEARHHQELTSNGAVQTTVASTKGAIGYLSLANANDTVKLLRIDGVFPSAETVGDGSYPLQRPFLMAVKTGAALSPQAEAFLEFAVSEQGREIIAAIGLVPPAQ